MKISVKSVLVLVLLVVSAAMLFVPVVEGADDIRAMFVFLTGMAVRDYFSSESHDKNVAAVKEAYDPTPAKPYVPGQDV